MKFSLSLPVLRNAGHPDPFQETFELARIAEESGFDTATIGHHHFMPGNMSDPLTFLTAVAVRTTTLRVGTGIFQLPAHNPIRVAEQVATIDQLSNGRVSLGVGLGWWPLEYQVHGSDFRERGARMEEALEILRLVWGEENTTFDGRFWQFPELTVHPRPVQRPRPPLWVAGVADAAVDRAARLGDAWMCGPVQSLAKAQSCLAVYRASCTEHGGPESGSGADWILRRYAWVGADHEQVAEDVLPAYVDGLVEHWRESVEDDAEKALFARMDAGEPVSPEEIAQDRLLWGAPDDVIAQIERYRVETACTHIHAAFGAGLPANASERSTFGSFDDHAAMIRLFGREVIPAFRERMTNSWTDPEQVAHYLTRVDELPRRAEGEAVLVGDLEGVLPGRILDLGTGNGRLTRVLLDAYPGSTAVCADLSHEMLRAAAEQFAGNPAVTLVQHDFDRELAFADSAHGPFDAVVSSLAIHHVSDARKPVLFGEVARLLEPGGIFANLDIVASPTQGLHDRWRDEMGARDDPSDQLRDVESQLRWLRDVGFGEVDCIWKWRSLALMRGELV